MNLFYYDSALSVIDCHSIIQLNCQNVILNRIVDLIFYINDTLKRGGTLAQWVALSPHHVCLGFLWVLQLS